LLLAACLAAAACSVSRIAYLNAPPLALWYVGGYFDMSDPQKAFFKERLSRAMAWHRQNELPEYRRAIEALIVKSQAKVEVDDVRAIYGLARNYYYRAVEHLLPDLADFVVQLDERQLGQAERKFADDNRKLVRESVKGTPEERCGLIPITICDLVRVADSKTWRLPAQPVVAADAPKAARR